MLSKHNAGKLFTRIIGINKIILILFLVGFAYFNHVNDYICVNPKQFMGESIGLGLSTANILHRSFKYSCRYYKFITISIFNNIFLQLYF